VEREFNLGGKRINHLGEKFTRTSVERFLRGTLIKEKGAGPLCGEKFWGGAFC